MQPCLDTLQQSVNAENKISQFSQLEENLVHMTIGEKNFKDSLVSFPPQGKSCMQSVVKSAHHESWAFITV